MMKVKLLDPSDPSRRLERYELIGELASGGMATVYLARLAGVGGFQRFVAIKRLHPHLASEQEFIEMFLDEARLAAGIHHPNVVPILEVGQSARGYYIVMEYIEGDTLARLVSRGLSSGKPVPRPVLLRVVVDVLSGLHAAHELTDGRGGLVHLVHRDCSPQNILVGVDGCSRIADFGLARASSRLASTRSDRLKGKIAYMSPEQANGDLSIDRRSDVFAMGVILWEVLAERRLFKADTEAGTLRRVMVDPIAPVSSVAPGVHPAIEAVCARALDRDIAQRFQTAAEMAEAIERAAREAAPGGAPFLASPRDVAAYLQGALGQDIAAQRESVRAWLSHIEPPPPEPPAKAPAAPAKVAGGVTLVGVGRDAPTAPALPPAVPIEDPDTEDESETLLMDRTSSTGLPALPLPAARARASSPPAVIVEPQLPPSPPLSSQLETTHVSLRPSIEQPPSRRLIQGLAVAVGMLLVLSSVLLWITLRAPSSEANKPAEAPAARTASAVPPPPSLPPQPSLPQPSPAPSPPPAAVEAPAPSAAATELPAQPRPTAPAGNRQPPRKTAPSGAPAPASPPGNEDLSNPYR